MMGMLSSIGIERGKPYAPDETATRAMRQAAIDAWPYLQAWHDDYPAKLYQWPDRHYASLLLLDANGRFTFVYDDRIDLISRAALYFAVTYMPERFTNRPANVYLTAMAGRDGRPLEAGGIYKVDVPADMPASEFRPLTVYDRATFAFIYSDLNRTTLSSLDLGTMRKNPDGGVTLYVGPEPPPGSSRTGSHRRQAAVAVAELVPEAPVKEDAPAGIWWLVGFLRSCRHLAQRLVGDEGEHPAVLFDGRGPVLGLAVR